MKAAHLSEREEAPLRSVVLFTFLDGMSGVKGAIEAPRQRIENLVDNDRLRF